MSREITIIDGRAKAITPVLADDAAPYIRAGLIVVGLFFGLLLGWAAFARLDAAAIGDGVVAVSGHRQTVQHREGGVVQKLLVREGQHVQAGQLVIELVAADVRAQERALASSVIGLEAQRARLEAELAEQSRVAVPADFAALTPENRKIADAAMRLQVRQFEARRSSLGSSRQVLHQRQSEVGAQITGFRNQDDATAQQRKLLEDQLAGTQKLAAEGYASTNTVRQLQRAISQLDGQRADFASRSASGREQIGELTQQVTSERRKYLEDSSAQLRDTLFQLNEQLPKWQAAKDQLARVEIRAPVTGKVVGLSTFTVGGVIAPGEKLMDIVPDAAPLTIQANFLPTNIDGVVEGARAQVKFTSFHERDLPLLDGVVHTVSADSLTDEKSGQHYYTAEVIVPEDQIAILRRVRGPDIGLRPGLQVQVNVPLRKRTALDYLVEPITEAFGRSFRER